MAPHRARPVGWERIHFHCFSDQEVQRLFAGWSKLSLRTGEPDVSTVRNGVIPMLPSPPNRKDKRIACVYDGMDQPVATSIRLRGSGAEQCAEPDPVTLHEARFDNRPAYFLGNNMRHYGHFLLDTLSRAWAWEKQEGGHAAIVLLPPIPAFARSLCALIPGLAERLEILRATTRFAHVMVPSPAFSTGMGAHFIFKEMCERMAEQAVPVLSPMTEQPLYLSRAGLHAGAKRAIAGEERLERFFAKEGFCVARPETLPIPEQIALFNRHKWIISPLGSACHSRLFSRRAINLVLLTGTMHNGSDKQFKTNYALCDLLSEGSTHYVQVLHSPKPEAIASCGRQLEVEEQKLLAFLKKSGLVKSSAAFDEPAVNGL